MFKQTFIGDYVWEINSHIYLHYVDNNYLNVYVGEPTTTISIDNVNYPLLGDLRKQFEATEGDLEKIKKIYIDNVELSDTPIPHGESYAPLLKVFIDHINQYI